MIGVYAFISKHQMQPTYIGYSVNVESRIKNHFANRRSFTFDTWLICQPFDTKKEAYDEEQRLIQKFNPPENRTSRERRRFNLYECECIEEVLRGYEHPPWQHMSMIDSVYYKSARDKWIEQGRVME